MTPSHSRPLSCGHTQKIRHKTEKSDDNVSVAGFESSLAFGLAGRHSLFSVGLLPPLKGHGSRYLIAILQGRKKVFADECILQRETGIIVAN